VLLHNVECQSEHDFTAHGSQNDSIHRDSCCGAHRRPRRCNVHRYRELDTGTLAEAPNTNSIRHEGNRLSREIFEQGPFAPRTLLRFLATADPAATLSSSADFPVSPVIRPTLLRRFRAETRRASPVAQHVLVTVRRFHPAEVNSRIGQCSAAPAAFALRR
jgi:hypothetical protein